MQKYVQKAGPFFNLMTSHPQWHQEIRPLLEKIANREMHKHKLIQTLFLFHQKYCWRRKDHFPRRKDQNYNFKVLLDVTGGRFQSLLSKMAAFLLRAEPKPISIVTGDIKKRYDYTHDQLFYILVLMFFCLVPKQKSDRTDRQGQFAHKNHFAHIFSFHLFKTQCLVRYFQDNIQSMLANSSKGIFSIVRNFVKQKLENILQKQQKMRQIIIQQDKASIQDYVGNIKVDFANQYIGGGCLNNGCVQEQIMFALRPQLYATTQLCQRMTSNEALGFIGFKKHLKCKGYGNNTFYDGIQNIQYHIDEQGRANQYIVGIDAIHFKQRDPSQFYKKNIDRQILKAYAGFSCLDINQKHHVVTGGWGCGVFNGDLRTKLIIQWIAASLAGRSMIFCPFGKQQFLSEHFPQFLTNMPVRKVYRSLMVACQEISRQKGSQLNLFRLMKNSINPGNY